MRSSLLSCYSTLAGCYNFSDFRAPARCGYLKLYPIFDAASGTARWPFKSISAISPTKSANTYDGTDAHDGRSSASPSALENTSIVTGFGAVALNAPRAASFSIRKEISSISSSI